MTHGTASTNRIEPQWALAALLGRCLGTATGSVFGSDLSSFPLALATPTRLTAKDLIGRARFEEVAATPILTFAEAVRVRGRVVALIEASLEVASGGHTLQCRKRQLTAP